MKMDRFKLPDEQEPTDPDEAEEMAIKAGERRNDVETLREAEQRDYDRQNNQ